MALQSPKQYLLSGHILLNYARPDANICKRIEPFFSLKSKADQTFIDTYKDNNYIYQKIYNGKKKEAFCFQP